MSARDRLRDILGLQGVTASDLLGLREGVKFLCAEVDRLESVVRVLSERLSRLEGDGK